MRLSDGRQANRRNVNPATADRIYTDEEREFLRAIDQFQTRTGKRILAWSEVLDIFKSLGYVRLDMLDDGQLDLGDSQHKLDFGRDEF
jgi:hypothetical protein